MGRGWGKSVSTCSQNGVCFVKPEATIDQFTVACLVTWPLDGSEARVDPVMIQTSFLLLCKTSCSDVNKVHLHDKSREVCIKTRSTLASLPSTGQVAEETTVKWSIVKASFRSFCSIFDQNTLLKTLQTNRKCGQECSVERNGF